MSDIVNIPGLVIGTKHLATHPFKEAVSRLIANHLAPHIAKRFYFILEAEKYSKADKGVTKQFKDGHFVMEVYYTHKSGLVSYICDVFSRWDKEFTNAHLLRMITDKVKAGEIGSDWTDADINVSHEIRSGRFMTRPEEAEA